MKVLSRVLFATGIAFAVSLLGGLLCSAEDAKYLSVAEARQYVLGLVNRDRAKFRLMPLTLDARATIVAQSHAEEMAKHSYISHWNLAGKKPLQRYNEAGGLDDVGENLAIIHFSTVLPEDLFTQKDLDSLESLLFNQKPPDDLHRRQIITPEHN